VSFLGRRFQCTLGFSINTARLLFIGYRNVRLLRRGPKKIGWRKAVRVQRLQRRKLAAAVVCLSHSRRSATHSPRLTFGFFTQLPPRFRNILQFKKPARVPLPIFPRLPLADSLIIMRPPQLPGTAWHRRVHPSPPRQALAVCRRHSASARARGSVAQIMISDSKMGHITIEYIKDNIK
jgi:hypothetical protein